MVATPGTLASFNMGTRPYSHRRRHGDRKERARANRQGDEGQPREPYGDLQAGLKRIFELKEKVREQAGRKLIRCGTTWQTVRLARVQFR